MRRAKTLKTDDGGLIEGIVSAKGDAWIRIEPPDRLRWPVDSVGFDDPKRLADIREFCAWFLVATEKPAKRRARKGGR